MLLNVSLSLVYDFISKHYSNNQPINQTIQNTSFKGSPDSPSIFPVRFESSIRTLFWRRRSFSSHTADKKPIKVGYSGKVWGFKPQKGKPTLDFEKHSTFFFTFKKVLPRVRHPWRLKSVIGPWIYKINKIWKESDVVSDTPDNRSNRFIIKFWSKGRNGTKIWKKFENLSNYLNGPDYFRKNTRKDNLRGIRNHVFWCEWCDLKFLLNEKKWNK